MSRSLREQQVVEPLLSVTISCVRLVKLWSWAVRRSALISLSNLNDDQMAHAKSGKWWENEGQRALANNSVAYKQARDGYVHA